MNIDEVVEDYLCRFALPVAYFLVILRDSASC